MKTLLLLLLALVGSPAAFAGASSFEPVSSSSEAMDTFTILVAPSGSAAYAYAQTQDNGSTIFAQSALWRAVRDAAALVNEGGERTVLVLVAEGDYPGQFAAGIQRVPKLENAAGTLKVFGGMNDDFSERDPFSRPSRVPTAMGRDGAIFQIAGNSVIREVVISGLVLDASPSNNYDVMSGSLQKGSSSSSPVIGWAQMEAERVVIADNVIANGAMAGFQIGSTPPVAGTGEVVIQNNVFLNNLLALRTQTFGRRAGFPYARLLVRNNTFALNFPFNPDPTSSNVSAVEWHNDNSFDELVFENNIFAFNPGGAFQSDWAPDRLPALTIRDNLFYFNGPLFGESGAGAVIVAGKFGTNPQYILLDIDGVRDNLDAEVSGNTFIDPQLRLALVADQPVDRSFIKAQVDELEDPRELFGFGSGPVEVSTFAPEMLYDERVVPVTGRPAARPYGIQRNDVWGMDD